MSSQSWNAIPASRREALAARQRQRINEDWSDGDDDDLDKPQSKKSGEWSSGSSGGYATEKTTNSSSQELGEESDLLKQHSAKLESLETRIEKLLTLNEKMEERSKKLEDLVVQVAEQVGVRHDLGGSSRK